MVFICMLRAELALVLLVWAEAGAAALRRSWRSLAGGRVWPPRLPATRAGRQLESFIHAGEAALITLPAAGMLLLSLAGLLWLCLA